MKNKALLRTGNAKLPNFSFQRYPRSLEKIIEAVKACLPDNGEDLTSLLNYFIKDIENSIRWSLFYQELPSTTRANIKKQLEGLWGTETIEEVKERMPPELKGWLYTLECSPHKVKTQHDVSKIVQKLNRRAKRELAGTGRDMDVAPIFLATDIAAAFKKIDIEPVASRPTDSGRPSAFHTVVQECLRLAGFAYKDPYPQMKAALESLQQDKPKG